MARFIGAIAALGLASRAFAYQPEPVPAAQPTAGDPDIVCKYVVAAGRDDKPYQLCQSKAKWAAKAAADAKDANHMVCRYQQETASRIKVGKRCQTADQWAEEERETRQHVEEIQARSCQGQGPC
jgi:hypothetical protein